MGPAKVPRLWCWLQHEIHQASCCRGTYLFKFALVQVVDVDTRATLFAHSDPATVWAHGKCDKSLRAMLAGNELLFFGVEVVDDLGAARLGE